MKIILTIFLLLITIYGFPQPGAKYQNLNEINDEKNILADVIVIDSTSDLSKINMLKNELSLQLDIRNLEEMPKEFINFTKTEYLTLRFYKVEAADLSFLNEFPNLKYLRIDDYAGEILSRKHLVLDSLTHLEIGYCPNLYDIEAIKELDKLEELSINNVAALKAFPKFSKQNSIKKLEIDHMSNGRQFNEENPQNYKTDIQNIKYLEHLEELTLGSLTFINNIPGYFPKSIKKLQITGWALHHWKGDKVEIKNIDNLKLYPGLKEVRFYNVHLKELKGHFNNLSLDYLLLWYIPDLTDISGVFSFKKIKQLKIDNCATLKTISGATCKNTIEKIEIAECPDIENIDFLFTCQRLNALQVYPVPGNLKISRSVSMDKIPNISISSSNGEIRLFKKDNTWQERTIKK